MKIGLLREEKLPADKRVVFTPKQCKNIKLLYKNLNIVVQSSDKRCFSDLEYTAEGIDVVEDLHDCDILFGVKEVPKSLLIPNKKYFFFSHTIKEQPYNRALLAKMVDLKITMIDYEVLKNTKGERLLGFGRFAGIIGAYNTFLTYGLKSAKFTLKPAYKCIDKEEMFDQLNNIILDKERFIVTGNGRVGKGILEVMQKARIRQVLLDEYIYEKFNEPVFLHLDTMDYNERIDGLVSNKQEFYTHPELYKSTFTKYTKKSDIFIAGHYYATGSPYLFTKNDALSNDFNLKVIADISCDIDGPIASTLRASTIESPIYGYHPITQMEVDYTQEDAIAVMAVSNLPCELPKDASEDFGKSMLEKIIPLLVTKDNDKILESATICSNGSLNSKYEYLRGYISKV